VTSTILSSAPDYGCFRFNCAVDFIMVRVELAQASNGWSVREATGVTYAHPLDKGAGGAASTFVMRFDDPGSWAGVHQRLDALRVLKGFKSEPQLAEIEVSFDAYSRGMDHAELLGMTERFFKFSNMCSDNARLVRKDGDEVVGPYYVSSDLLTLKLKQGYIVAVGNVADHVRQRIYLKTTDRAGAVHLKPQQHRARIEVTLKDDMLPFTSLAQASAFKFETLNEWFRFRKPRPGLLLSPVQLLMLRRHPALGSRVRCKRKNFHGWTAADRALSDRAYDALRYLTQKMNATRGLGRGAEKSGRTPGRRKPSP